LGIEHCGGAVHRFAPGPEVVLLLAGPPGLSAAPEETLEGVAVGVHQAREQKLAGKAFDRSTRGWEAGTFTGAVRSDGEREVTDEAALPDEGLGLEPAGHHGPRGTLAMRSWPERGGGRDASTVDAMGGPRAHPGGPTRRPREVPWTQIGWWRIRSGGFRFRCWWGWPWDRWRSRRRLLWPASRRSRTSSASGYRHCSSWRRSTA